MVLPILDNAPSRLPKEELLLMVGPIWVTHILTKPSQKYSKTPIIFKIKLDATYKAKRLNDQYIRRQKKNP